MLFIKKMIGAQMIADEALANNANIFIICSLITSSKKSLRSKRTRK